MGLKFGKTIRTLRLSQNYLVLIKKCIFCMIVLKIKNIRSGEISVSRDKSKLDIKKVKWQP